MKKLSDYLGEELSIARVSVFKREFEFRSSNELIGKMYFPKFFSLSAIVEGFEDKLEIKSTSFWRSELGIFKSGYEMPFAKYTSTGFWKRHPHLSWLFMLPMVKALGNLDCWKNYPCRPFAMARYLCHFSMPPTRTRLIQKIFKVSGVPWYSNWDASLKYIPQLTRKENRRGPSGNYLISNQARMGVSIQKRKVYLTAYMAS